jgi:hypothetical protein
MTYLGEAFGFLDRLSELSPQQRLLRAAMAGTSLVFLALIPAAGGRFHPLLSAAIVLLCLLAALVPDTSVALFLVLALVTLWGIAVPETLDGWLLLAALDLVALHVCCLLASYGPTSIVLDRRLLRLWVGRTGLLVAATVLVWGACLLALRALPSGGVWAFTAGLVVLLVWLGVASARLFEAAD